MTIEHVFFEESEVHTLLSIQQILDVWREEDSPRHRKRRAALAMGFGLLQDNSGVVSIERNPSTSQGGVHMILNTVRSE